MNQLVIALMLAAFFLSGCGPSESQMQTAVAETQSVESLQATEAAAATLAAAPTSTRTPVPPTPTATVPPGPTASGKFEFFEVSLEQAGDDRALVSFGYQLEQGVSLDGLKIMAQAVIKGANCDTMRFTIFSSPYLVTEPVGVVKGSDSVSMAMQDVGDCDFKGFSLMVFRVENNKPVSLYDQVFETPFTLEKK